jgi:hypothetical protein
MKLLQDTILQHMEGIYYVICCGYKLNKPRSMCWLKDGQTLLVKLNIYYELRWGMYMHGWKVVCSEWWNKFVVSVSSLGFDSQHSLSNLARGKKGFHFGLHHGSCGAVCVVVRCLGGSSGTNSISHRSLVGDSRYLGVGCCVTKDDWLCRRHSLCLSCGNNGHGVDWTKFKARLEGRTEKSANEGEAGIRTSYVHPT